MDFELTEEQRMIRDTARDLADKVTEGNLQVRSAIRSGRRRAVLRFLGFDRKWAVDLRNP